METICFVNKAQLVLLELHLKERKISMSVRVRKIVTHFYLSVQLRAPQGCETEKCADIDGRMSTPAQYTIATETSWIGKPSWKWIHKKVNYSARELFFLQIVFIVNDKNRLLEEKELCCWSESQQEEGLCKKKKGNSSSKHNLIQFCDRPHNQIRFLSRENDQLWIAQHKSVDSKTSRYLRWSRHKSIYQIGHLATGRWLEHSNWGFFPNGHCISVCLVCKTLFKPCKDQIGGSSFPILLLHIHVKNCKNDIFLFYVVQRLYSQRRRCVCVIVHTKLLQPVNLWLELSVASRRRLRCILETMT